MHLDPLIGHPQCLMPAQAVKFFDEVEGADDIATGNVAFHHLLKAIMNCNNRLAQK